jgi:hypothetical protein
MQPLWEACAAAVRTARPDSTVFILLVTQASRKTIFSESHSGRRSVFRGIKFVSTDSQEISNRLDERVQDAINQLGKCRDLQIPPE